VTTVAVLLAAAAAALLVPPQLRRSGLRPADGPRRRVGAGPGAAAAFAVSTALLVVTVEGRQLALALIVLATAAGVALLVRRARRSRVAEWRAGRVVEAAEALVGELRAGQPLVTSLEHCVQVWPELDTVVSAARLGADVPSALRRLAGLRGAEGLREVASAWQVSQRSGAGLATALGHVADTARARQATRQLVQGELASAQATARLVALLPLASLAMSAGIGGHPWHFLLGTTPGLVCLALGLLFAFAGLLWIDRIADGVLRGEHA
jgi:tight adherence protein B